MKLNKNNNFSLIAESVKSFTSAISAEDPQDKSTELETESYLEDQAQQERMEAKEEKLTAKAREDTDNEEYLEEYLQEMELREQEKVDYGPDGLHSND